MSPCCIATRAIQWTDSAPAPPLLQFLVFAHCRRTCIFRESHARRKSHDSIDPIAKQIRSEEVHLTALSKPFRLHGVLRRCREGTGRGGGVSQPRSLIASPGQNGRISRVKRTIIESTSSKLASLSRHRCAHRPSLTRLGGL